MPNFWSRLIMRPDLPPNQWIVSPALRIKAPEKSAGQQVLILISFAGDGLIKQAQRSGFHNLRHSLGSFLITGQKSDVRTTQVILRHSSSATTLDLYTQSPMAQRIAAQVLVLRAILGQPTARVRIRAVRRTARRGKIYFLGGTVLAPFAELSHRPM